MVVRSVCVEGIGHAGRRRSMMNKLQQQAGPVTPLIIITVTLNNRIELLRTARAVSALPVELVSWIVVDGGSTYFTDAFLAQLRTVCPVRACVSSPDQGIYDAMNRGLDLAADVVRDAPSQYVCFMNSGDEVHPEFDLRDFLSYVSCTDNAQLYAGTSLRVGANSQWKRKPKRTLRHLSVGMPFEHQAVFVRADVALLHRFDCRYTCSADYEYFCRIRSSCPHARYLVYPHLVCRFQVGGVSYAKRLEAILEDSLIRRRINRMSFAEVYALLIAFVFQHMAKRIGMGLTRRLPSP